MVGISSEESSILTEAIEKEDESSSLCPMCGTELSIDAIECSECGEPFSPEAFETSEEDEKRGKFNKRLFWSGVILIFLGGPGISFGSWLHDLLKINFPAGYDAWSVFGWVNKMVATVGIIILVIGIVLLILSIVRERPEDFVEDQELYEGVD